MNPALIVILTLIIGIVVGVGATRMNRPAWLTKTIAGGRRNEVTSALVGIAGAFIGFHIAALFEAGAIILLVFAIIGAVVVVWAWREVKLQKSADCLRLGKGPFLIQAVLGQSDGYSSEALARRVKTLVALRLPAAKE